MLVFAPAHWRYVAGSSMARTAIPAGVVPSERQRPLASVIRSRLRSSSCVGRRLCAATQKDPLVGSGCLHKRLQRANEIPQPPQLLRHLTSLIRTRERQETWREVRSRRRDSSTVSGVCVLCSLRGYLEPPARGRETYCGTLGAKGKRSSTFTFTDQEDRLDPVWLLDACWSTPRLRAMRTTCTA